MLFEENPNDYGIVCGFWQMCNCTAAAVNKRNYEVTAEDYKRLSSQNQIQADIGIITEK